MRMYGLKAVNFKTKKETILHSTPMTHHQVCVFKSKFISHDHCMHVIYEIE